MTDRPTPTASPHVRRQRAANVGAIAAALGAIAVLVSAVLAPGAPLRAQSTVTAQVMVILASTEPGTIAPELAGIPALRRGPFAPYNTMSLLATHPASLVVGTATEIPLPNGRTLGLLADAPTAAGLYPIHLTIGSGESRLLHTTLNAERCVPAFFAGQPYLGGTLILGVRVGDGCR
jgi:hypothetical protein